MKTDKNKPNCKPVYTRDSLKAVDILDAAQKLRYKVVMTSYDVFNDHYGTLYEIEVLNCFTTPEPLIIVSRPDDKEEPITDYGKAVTMFNEYVDQYKALVEAETRGLQDIEVYKEKFGYEETLPACCETCKWVKRHDQRWPMRYDPFTRLECANPKNQFELDQNVHCNPILHFFHKNGEAKHSETRVLCISPRVKMFGCCTNYEKNDKYVDDYIKFKNPPFPCRPHPLDPPWVRPYSDHDNCDVPMHQTCKYNGCKRCPRDVQHCSDCENRV